MAFTDKFEIAKSSSSVVQLSLLYFIIGTIFLLIPWASSWLDIPVEHFTADPARSYNAHPLTGIISHIGVLLWCSTAAICLYSSVLLKLDGETRDARFLFYSGLLSMVLLFDDLFMFHEALFPWYFHIPQRFVYVGYILMTVVYFFYFRKDILNSEYKILTIAIILLGLSVLGDFVLPQEGIAYLFEDGFKAFGIATWAVYFMRLSFYRTLTDPERTKLYK